MPWLQLRVHSKPEHAPSIEHALEQIGALSITFEDSADQPIFEPALGEAPLWNDTRITGLFDAEVDTTGLSEQFQQLTGLEADRLLWQALEDKDWEREWMTHFQPIHCGEDLWICPCLLYTSPSPRDS